MHNIKTNFDKFFNLSKLYLKDFIVDSSYNFQLYRNKPKMSDCEIIALSLCSIGFKLQTAKKQETREKRMAEIIEKLAKREKLQ